MFVCAISAEGAPSLRFLQGRGGDAADTTFVLLLSFCTNPSRVRPWFPPFANCAKDGAPTVLVIPAKSKAGATAPIVHFSICLESKMGEPYQRSSEKLQLQNLVVVAVELDGVVELVQKGAAVAGYEVHGANTPLLQALLRIERRA